MSGTVYATPTLANPPKIVSLEGPQINSGPESSRINMSPHKQRYKQMRETALNQAKKQPQSCRDAFPQRFSSTPFIHYAQYAGKPVDLRTTHCSPMRDREEISPIARSPMPESPRVASGVLSSMRRGTLSPQGQRFDEDSAPDWRATKTLSLVPALGAPNAFVGQKIGGRYLSKKGTGETGVRSTI